MRSFKLLQIFNAFIILVIPVVVSSAELGAIGPMYPIQEESALDMMTRKLQAKEKTGELKKMQEAAIKRSLNSIKNIPSVPGISTVEVRKSRLVDPTVKYSQAITTDEGQIVVPAGAVINPFVYMNLSKKLVFFNGDDPAQREAVKKMVIKYKKKIKPILVSGSWLDLTKSWKMQVYFDQHGTLSKRFAISAVPTVISQDGMNLRIDEIPAKELQ